MPAIKGDYTALMLAASNNHPEIIDQLISEGADPNIQEQTLGWTALIWAAKRGHSDSVKHLLARNANRSTADFKGNTALDWAIKNKHEQVTALLTR